MVWGRAGAVNESGARAAKPARAVGVKRIGAEIRPRPGPYAEYAACADKSRRHSWSLGSTVRERARPDGRPADRVQGALSSRSKNSVIRPPKCLAPLPGGSPGWTLGFSLVCPAVFCFLAVVAAHLWRARFARGPLEMLMRRVTA